MKNFINEFQSFIIKGNAIDMAIGVIIGFAFNAVVNSFAHDIVLGAIANVFSQPDFSAFAWGAVKWGTFLNNIVNLIIIGLSVFLMIKVINRLTGAKIGQAPAETKQ